MIKEISYIIAILILIYTFFRKDIFGFLMRKQEFKCNRCGHCCRLYVELNDKDIEAIKSKGYKEEDFVEKKLTLKFIKRKNWYCPFLSIKNGESQCEIYEVRPLICRKFPKIKCFGIDGYDYRCCALKKPKYINNL